MRKKRSTFKSRSKLNAVWRSRGSQRPPFNTSKRRRRLAAWTGARADG